MLFDLHAFIRGQLTLPQFELLAQLELNFGIEINGLQLLLPKIDAEINIKLPFLDKLEEIFNFVNNYISNFELEMEGINGTNFFKIDSDELVNMALGESVIWNNIIFGKTSANFDVPDLPILSGGAFGPVIEDNELDGIDLEIEGINENNANKIAQGKAKQQIGLDKEKTALEFLSNVYGVDVSVALSNVNDAISHLGDTGPGRVTYLNNRKAYLINTRIDENTNFRNEHYGNRRSWLNLLVSRSIGIKTKVESLKQSKNFIINSINSSEAGKNFIHTFRTG